MSELHRNAALYVELYGVVSGWAKLRMMDRLIDAYPKPVPREVVVEAVWPTRHKPAVVMQNIRVMIYKINSTMIDEGLPWRVSSRDKGSLLVLTRKASR